MAVLETEVLTRRFDKITAVDALRALMVVGGVSTYGIGLDLGILLAATTLLVILAARLYPRVVI